MKDKKYRILQVHNYYQIPGGEDTVVTNEKKLLEDHGHTVIQYTRNNSELKEFSIFRKLVLPITTIFNPRTYWDVKKIIKNENIDIVHVHNTLNLVSPAVYYVALNCKTPIVQTVHNFRLLCPGAIFCRDGKICEDCVERGLHCAIKYNCYRNSKAQTLICAISTWIHRRTGVYKKINYICLTEFNKEKLLYLKQIKPEKVFVKPNLVEDSGVITTPYEQRDNQIIFVGRLDKTKGIDILLEAWRLLGKDAPMLLICGTGPMDNWCKDYIRKNDLNSVEMRGHVPNKVAKELIANSKALILPTQMYEGLPMTIVEAYSVGTPVIGSNIGNVGNLIEDGVTGVKFEYNSSVDLARTVSKYLNSDCKTMKLNPRKYYEENYSSCANYSNLMRIYEAV